MGQNRDQTVRCNARKGLITIVCTFGAWRDLQLQAAASESGTAAAFLSRSSEPLPIQNVTGFTILSSLRSTHCSTRGY
jgi:hypothetical protein